MDGKQENTSFSTIFILAVVVALTAPACSSPELPHVGLDEGQVPPEVSEDCPGDEYRSTKGHCCNKCHAGFRLEKECLSSNLKSQCTPCLSDQYLENSNNADKCFRCRNCYPNFFQKEVSPCTRVKDRQCACIDGRFRQNIIKDTFQCLECDVCGEGEREVKPCLGEKNRECDCKEKFYRISKRKCIECKKCTDDQNCQHLCGQSDTDWQLAFLVMLCIVAMLILFAVGVLILKRHPCDSEIEEIEDSQKSFISKTSEQSSLTYEDEGKMVKDSSIPIPLAEHELPTQQALVEQVSGGREELPDCVPRGFKACQFIYFLLQHVPASRFKELVRCLGVSERDIEWAERDNRAFKEAQFQMLKVWCDSGGGTAADTLSRARLLQVTDTLRAMGLATGAEAVETNFQIL